MSNPALQKAIEESAGPHMCPNCGAETPLPRWHVVPGNWVTPAGYACPASPLTPTQED